MCTGRAASYEYTLKVALLSMRITKSKFEKMEERISSQLKGRKLEELEELNLDNVRVSRLSGLTDQFTGLKRLSIINVGLSSLEGFPELPALERLELGDNRLAGGLEYLKGCPALQHLSLVGNRLALLDDLRPLAELVALVSLDLLDCPVTQQEGYRELVFNILPRLGALDGLNREGEEVEESDSEDDEVDGSDSDEPGLDYLQQELGSGSSEDEEDYNPEGEEVPEDDDIIPSSEGEEGEGPSLKRPRLDPSPKATLGSDSD